MKLTYKLILFFALLLWCTGIFIELLISLNEYFVFLLPFFQKTYSLVCHQEKTKLIQLGIGETLTCARCTGIYLGLLFPSILILFKETIIKLSLRLLLTAAIPLIADVVLYSFNIYSYSKLIAFCTGFLLGSVGFLYLYAGLKNLIKEMK